MLRFGQKGAAPAGYLTEKDAEAQLQAILTDARRGGVEQIRTGTTFDVAADEWLTWGVRDRDWKPSTLSDNRSVVRAHLLPAFRGQRIEKIAPDDIEQWRDELIDERGASRRTANKCLIVLGAILERSPRRGALARRGSPSTSPRTPTSASWKTAFVRETHTSRQLRAAVLVAGGAGGVESDGVAGAAAVVHVLHGGLHVGVAHPCLDLDDV